MVRCTASRTNGLPCRHWAITGGWVCRNHGGAARQVREAAARRWEYELLMRRIIGGIERRTGRPVDPALEAWMRAQAPADPATFRRHRRSDDPTPWHPRTVVPNLYLLAEERARGRG